MDLRKILNCFDTVPISPNATIIQLRHEEDDSPYQVWKIDSNNESYILKEAKGDEKYIYTSASDLFMECVPLVYQITDVNEKTYILMEYVEGADLCRCNRKKLTLALDALIALQKKTWEISQTSYLKETFENSLTRRQNRGKYLDDTLLEKAYDEFMIEYNSTPKTLCHDDLLPFNIITTDNRAVLIDWEVSGMLPYPTSFVRLIAHTQESDGALFYMTENDKKYAIDYYYENLLKEKGILYQEWINTVEYFLFYEYCEWIFVGNKYQVTDGEYYKKYFPLAKQQAAKILQLNNKQSK